MTVHSIRFCNPENHDIELEGRENLIFDGSELLGGTEHVTVDKRTTEPAERGCMSASFGLKSVNFVG
jgi:hypothetical protein